MVRGEPPPEIEVGEEELKEDSIDLGDRYHGCGPWRVSGQRRLM